MIGEVRTQQGEAQDDFYIRVKHGNRFCYMSNHSV